MDLETVKKIPHFMEPEGPLPCSQEPIIMMYEGYPESKDTKAKKNF
jgi:hypothetical protein